MSDPKRYELNAKLEECCPRVYFNPPEGTQLVFPCIVYNRRYGDHKYADNKVFLSHVAYQVTVMYKSSDTDITDKILDKFTMVRLENDFIEKGLNHTVFLLYYRY